MRDLMQDRIAHFVDPIEKREMTREGDAAIGVIALSEPPPSMIELKPPSDQRVLRDQLASEIGGFVQVH
jgi:hypothetical protein